MKNLSFFVAATGQNVGKTTTALGLVSGLLKRYSRVGFIKPVGQEHVEIETGAHVDKDVVLFKSYFNLEASYESMSPVLFPRGFTRDFLDGKISHQELVDRVISSYKMIQDENEMTVIEGTGHIGVGSIANLNNAQVASHLKVPIIFVAPGGLGSSFDDLMLNFALCEKLNVRVAGVILNRVLEEKKEMVIRYMNLALKRLNIPLLGAIPYTPFLSIPVMNDFELLFQTKLLTGEEHRFYHFEHIRLVATSVEVFKTHIVPSQIIITPASREDIILATLTRYWDTKISHPEENLVIGLILTGKYPPEKKLIDQIRAAKIPMIYAPISSFVALKMINTFTAKIRKEDREKISKAEAIVAENVDFDALEKAISTNI